MSGLGTSESYFCGWCGPVDWSSSLTHSWVSMDESGLRVSSFKFEVRVLDLKKMNCSLWVGGQSVPLLKDFTSQGVFFTSDVWMRWTGEVRLVFQKSRCCSLLNWKRSWTEKQSSRFTRTSTVCSDSDLWSWDLDHDLSNKIPDRNTVDWMRKFLYVFRKQRLSLRFLRIGQWDHFNPL